MKSDAQREMSGRNLAVRRAVEQSLAALGGKPLETETDAQSLRAAPLRRALAERALTLMRDPLGLLRWEIGGAAIEGPGFRALAAAQARRAGPRRAPLARPRRCSLKLFSTASSPRRLATG